MLGIETVTYVSTLNSPMSVGGPQWSSSQGGITAITMGLPAKSSWRISPNTLYEIW